jgi:cytoskeleton protein RodZ
MNAMSEAASILGREGKKSLGARFAAAREKRGLSIEQVASETRIRAQRLREIERDDYSQFSHPSYARMYVIDYAKYLGMPISRIRRLLPDAGVCGGDGYQYLEETACDYMRTNLPSGRRKRLLPKLAIASLFVLFGLAGFKLWITWRDIERLDLKRLVGGDEPALTSAPKSQEAAPSAPGTPVNSESAGTTPADPEVPGAEIPGRQTVPSDAESALLVGAHLDDNDRLR